MTNGNCCPDCGDRYSVVESRMGDGQPIMVYRRRRCSVCDYAIWTVEIPFNGVAPNNFRNDRRKSVIRGCADAR